MPKTLMLVFALLLSTAWLTAQEYPQSGSQQAGHHTSGQTKVQGCLEGSNGNYTLTASSGTTYQLQGDASKLSKHVGHEVQITGTPSEAGSSTGTMSGTSAGGAQQTLTVDTVKHISKTCTSTSK